MRKVNIATLNVGSMTGRTVDEKEEPASFVRTGDKMEGK